MLYVQVILVRRSHTTRVNEIHINIEQQQYCRRNTQLANWSATTMCIEYSNI